MTTPRRRVPTLAAWGLAAGLAAFAWGVVHLFELRFSLGDVYPPYSTLRADPLGAEAAFEALAAQPGLSVERNLLPLDRLGMTPFGATGRDGTGDAALACFYLGAPATYGPGSEEWPFLLRTAEVDRLETIMRRGGRVIVTFLPAPVPLTVRRLELARREAAGVSPTASPADGKGNPTPAVRPRRRTAAEIPPDLIARWGIDFRRTRPSATPAPDVTARVAVPADAAGADTSAGVSWHSTAAFNLDAAAARATGWRALYKDRAGQPVIVARRFGGEQPGGELILASDSYFLSNEALRAEPHPELLAALVGSGRRVIFDESHLGIGEHPGLMTLARRYRLQGALGALGLLAVLFVWKNTLSLVPPSPVPEGGGAVAGRDGAAGFLNLLRRGVPARDLPAVCLAQWEQSHAAAPPGALERLRAAVRQQAPAAAAYRAGCAALRPASKKSL